MLIFYRFHVFSGDTYCFFYKCASSNNMICWLGCKFKSSSLYPSEYEKTNKGSFLRAPSFSFTYFEYLMCYDYYYASCIPHYTYNTIIKMNNKGGKELSSKPAFMIVCEVEKKRQRKVTDEKGTLHFINHPWLHCLVTHFPRIFFKWSSFWTL